MNSSGVHRTLGFLKHLDHEKWKITVLTVAVEESQSSDDGLREKLPVNVEVFRARVVDFFKPWRLFKKYFGKQNASERSAEGPIAPKIKISQKKGLVQNIKDQISGLLQTPDNQIGWLLPALRQANNIPRPDLIYSTAPPFTGHIIAACLKRRWKVPLVTDFRDPWSGNPFNVVHGGLVSWWDRKLERFVMRASDAVIANTIPMAEMMTSFFPDVKNKITTITNGYDAEDYQNVVSSRTAEENTVLMVHIGLLYEQRDPLPFLEAVKRMAVNLAEDVPLRVQLIGRSENFDGMPLEEHVRRLDIEHIVELIPPMSHQEALSRAKGADILLLFAQGTTLQVPAKLFEYMALGSPIFSFCEPESATEAILKSLGNHTVVTTTDSDKIYPPMFQLVESVKTHHFVSGSTASTGPFTRKLLTQKFEHVLDKLVHKG